jgi:phosphoadenosine phosphosulfate reductase
MGYASGTDRFVSNELESLNRTLSSQDASARVAWALERFAGEVAVTSSFGAQAAVMLHLVVSQKPDIPVILVDTGYLFPETYRFIDDLTERLHLNLQVYRSRYSPAWQEARWGKRWEQGLKGIESYNAENKVEPLHRAFQELGVHAWLTGIRRAQSSTRQNLGVLALQQGRVKVHPIIDWTDRDVFLYLQKNNLPYHPLWEKGYVSIGDVHTTRPLSEGLTEEDLRFYGLKRECGIHEGAESRGAITPAPPEQLPQQ